MSDMSIGGMSLDGLDNVQLAVLIRLAMKAEKQFDLAGMTDMANQCMVLRNRAYKVQQGDCE